MRRVGDTYPNQHLEVVVRCYLYRWKVARKPGESGMPSVRPSPPKTWVRVP